MTHKISYEIIIQVEEVFTEWKEGFTVTRNAIACDIEGNAIDGYSLIKSKTPIVTISYNGKAISYRDLFESWAKYQIKGKKGFPSSSISIYSEAYPHCITFSGDSYYKEQFDNIYLSIQEFLGQTFECVFDLNSRRK